TNSNPFHSKILLKRLYFNNFKGPLTNFYWTVVMKNQKLISIFVAMGKTICIMFMRDLTD
ncbi:hypothetical protein, partial [uncultured Bacteroides sp.]|uniref:hypothetical protein n=1 Tax=uncultured Bacteroides sp. TaxID=162156 RepID=UPI00261BAFEE